MPDIPNPDRTYNVTLLGYCKVFFPEENMYRNVRYKVVLSSVPFGVFLVLEGEVKYSPDWQENLKVQFITAVDEKIEAARGTHFITEIYTLQLTEFIRVSCRTPSS
jgi:hypothetical protein